MGDKVTWKLDNLIVDTIDGIPAIEKLLKHRGISVDNIISIAVVNGNYWVFYKFCVKQ